MSALMTFRTNGAWLPLLLLTYTTYYFALFLTTFLNLDKPALKKLTTKDTKDTKKNKKLPVIKSKVFSYGSKKELLK